MLRLQEDFILLFIFKRLNSHIQGVNFLYRKYLFLIILRMYNTKYNY